MVFPGSVGSVGNLPSEDIVNFLNAMGIDTGLTTEAAISAATDIAALLDVPLNSRVSVVGTRETYVD